MNATVPGALREAAAVHADQAAAYIAADDFDRPTLVISRARNDGQDNALHAGLGRFCGLAESEGEAIRYQIGTPHDGSDVGPWVLAGPSCDSADIMYENRPVLLQLALQGGDREMIRDCGAYTRSYSSVRFNGFPPLDVIVL